MLTINLSMDKTAIGNKIIYFRKLKGITQELLSEKTGLNVRTIQRIESGEVDPRLYTLKSIAEALEVNLEELLPKPTQHELNQLAILHVTPAGFFLFPIIGNLLIPFIFFMLKREEIKDISRHGVDILNGQLTYSIIAGLLVGAQTILSFIPMFMPDSTMPHKFFRHFPIYMAVGTILSISMFIIFPGINAIRVYSGKEPFKYPLKINFFK